MGRRFLLKNLVKASVKENKVIWTNGYKCGTDREVFADYLLFIYQYAGTYSLSKEMKEKNVENLEAGDVFIAGGFPGHAVMTVDSAYDKKTNKKIMLLAQSYMPSQEFHILKSHTDISPWYHVEDEELITPCWKFEKGCLKEF